MVTTLAQHMHAPVDFGKEPKPFPTALILLLCLAILAAMLCLRKNPTIKKAVAEHALDKVLMQWNGDGDVFLRRDLVRSVCVQGASGSGKSSAVALQLVRALLRDAGIGGLILSSKPEDRQWWQDRVREAGRNELLVFGPDSPLRCNWLEWEMRAGADSQELASLMMIAGETLKRGEGGGTEADPFWKDSAERLLQFAIEAVRLGTGQLKPTEIYKFIIGMAGDPAQLLTPEWLTGFHHQTLKAAFAAPKTPIEQADFEQVQEYFLGEMPSLNSRTKTSILAQANQVLHAFCSGICRELLATTTNVTPAVLEEGNWLMVDMPQARYGASGQFVAAAWKLMMQRHILRRQASPDSAITVIFSDEFQNQINSHDPKFLAECRSHLGAMVVLTQSLHSFFAAIKGGQAGEHLAQALLTNFATRIFCTLGDAKSAEAASALLGQQLETMIGGNLAPSESLWDEIMRKGKFSGSFSTSYQPVLQPAVFLHGLRTGGPPHFCADAVVIRPEPFARGTHYLIVPFSQK